MPTLKKISSRRVVGWALIFIGVCGMVAAGIMYKTNSSASIVKSVAVQAAPSAKKPSQQDVASYSVPPTNPKYIAMPSIKLGQTRVVPLGVLKSGAIATPNNIFDAGWYTGSAKPGQEGAMFIYGHVSSWQANGAFYDLKKLKTGDVVIVTRGDGRIYNYKVVSSKIYPYDKVDMNQVLSPIQAGQPGLNLMTCTGQVIKGTSEFNERLVVFTTLAS